MQELTLDQMEYVEGGTTKAIVVGIVTSAIYDAIKYVGGAIVGSISSGGGGPVNAMGDATGEQIETSPV